MAGRPTEMEMMFTRVATTPYGDTMYKLPYEQCVQMANDATALAVQLAPKRTGWGAKGLYPIADDGMFGIGIRDWAYYMYYQEMGIQPFIMWSLEGKTIPMNIGGHIVFRKATHVGEQKRSANGQFASGRRWAHPGLAPKNFIETALDQTLVQNRPVVVATVGVNFLAQSLSEVFSVQ